MKPEKYPPKWALRLLRLYCKPNFLEQIEGDLFELYDRETNVKKANRRFVWNTIRFFRWRYIKGLEDIQQLHHLAMLKNYLKVAVRTLIKQKSYAGINILGLAIGLASCLLITVYIVHENSYDKHLKDVDRIYRIVVGEGGRFTPYQLAPALTEEYPQFEVATRMSGLFETLIKYDDDKILIQKGGAWADSNVFKVFEVEFLEGNSDKALTGPNNIVLTKSLATKLFQDESAMDKTLEIEGELFQVTGIVQDPPESTHFPYSFIGAHFLDERSGYSWTGNNFWTYSKVREGVSVEQVDQLLMALYEKYVGPELIAYTGHDTFDDLIAERSDRLFTYTAKPVRSIHLHHPGLSMGSKGSYRNVVIFSIVALFILLIACVNYINMSTARSAVRSKEVGIRKALGSFKKHIVWQFLVESLVITFIAILLSIVISVFTLDYFNQLTSRSFSIADLFSLNSMFAMLVLLILVGLLAGTYPAYVISSFSPIRALRGHAQQSGKRSLRSGLVSFQFAISVFLVAVTLIIYRQVMHMQNQDLGVDTEQVLVLYNGLELNDKYDVFKNQLLQLPEVQQVGKTSNMPFHGMPDYTYTYGEKSSIAPRNAFMSPEMFDVLGLELVEGRLFDPKRPMDTTKVIINESMAKALDYEQPIGEYVSRGEGLNFQIIGIVKDFNFTSLRRNIEPLIIRYGASTREIGPYHQSFIAIRLQTADVLSTMRSVDKYWSQHVQDYPLDATFLSDSFQRHFETELKFGQIFTTFAILAIFIAFLGLFSLTTFVLQKRYKEIAVRKVLGASVPSLLRMMLRDFTPLVIIGGLIGCIVAFYWLDEWLRDYSYRIELSWYLLAIPIAFMLILTWLVVILKSYKSAVSNPAHALKEE